MPQMTIHACFLRRTECAEALTLNRLTWVLAVEMASTGLAHMSKMISQQILRIGDPGFTKLNRFLTPVEGAVIAYGTIQKTVSYLDTENRMYANPCSLIS